MGLSWVGVNKLRPSPNFDLSPDPSFSIWFGHETTSLVTALSQFVKVCSDRSLFRDSWLRSYESGFPRGGECDLVVVEFHQVCNPLQRATSRCDDLTAGAAQKQRTLVIGEVFHNR